MLSLWIILSSHALSRAPAVNVTVEARDRQVIERRLRAQKARFLDCFLRTIGDPYEWQLHKRFTLNATIKPDGTLSLARDRTPEVREELERRPEGYRENQECLQMVVERVRLPARENAADVKVDVEY